MSSTNGDDSNHLVDSFMDEFSHFTSVFDQGQDGDEIDNERDEMIQQCYGRGKRVRKDFKAHLSGHFLQKCSGEDGDRSFDKFKIAPGDILKQVDERYICAQCYKSRRFFCYTCFTLSPQLEPHLPRMTLPVKIDIIKHVKEVDGKSTCPHAVMMAPNQCRVFIYPELPSDWPDDPNKILLIFPRKGVTPTVTEYLDEYFSSLFKRMSLSTSSSHSPAPTENCIENNFEAEEWSEADKANNPCSTQLLDFPFERVVFIDSTWRQTKPIINDPRLKRLPAVVIDAEETRFWRCDQRRPVTFLSTIEAIYYFCLQLHKFMANLADRIPDGTVSPEAVTELRDQFPAYTGQYDNLLFFFKYTYHVIKNRYQL